MICPLEEVPDPADSPMNLFRLIEMQIAKESDTALSLERKLKMHEARESIIDRLAANLPTSINLDTFLTVMVSELGRMMEVDRCDIIKLSHDGELSISHEWRAANDVPSTLGTRISFDLKQLSEHFDIKQ